MSCRKIVQLINTTSEGTPFETELDILFNLMLICCHQRLAYLLEIANFSYLMPAEDLLDRLRKLFPFFSYTVEHWIGDAPHRIFIHQKPLLVKIPTETHDEWVGRNLGFDCLGIPDSDQKRTVISYIVEDETTERSANFYTEICPPSVVPVSKQTRFQAVANFVGWIVREHIIEIIPDGYWIDAVINARACLHCDSTHELLAKQNDLREFLEGNGILEFKDLSLQNILANHYYWLVFTLLRIQNDPLEHLYPISTEMEYILNDIESTAFEKYGDRTVPYRNTPEGKYMFIELDKRFNRLFLDGPQRDIFEDKAQYLIDTYDGLMSSPTLDADQQEGDAKDSALFIEDSKEADVDRTTLVIETAPTISLEEADTLCRFQTQFLEGIREDEDEEREYAGSMGSELYVMNSFQFQNLPLILTCNGDPFYDSYSETPPYLVAVILKSAWSIFERHFTLPGFQKIVAFFSPLRSCRTLNPKERTPGTVVVHYGPISAQNLPPSGTCFAGITNWMTSYSREGWVDILVGESRFRFPKEPWTSTLEDYYYAVSIYLNDGDDKARTGPSNILFPALVRALRKTATGQHLLKYRNPFTKRLLRKNVIL